MNPDPAIAAFLAGVAACDGSKVVQAQVRTGALDDWFGDRYHPEALDVLAVGKAAPAMVWGLVGAKAPFRGLGVAVQGSRLPDLEGFHWHVGEHPVPGPGSFAAGRAVQDWLLALPEGRPLLVLLSGGASSLLELPADGDEAGLVTAWQEDFRAGLDITALNERRAARSALKGGGLARLAGDRPVRVWILQDTPHPAVVGSGPFWDGRVPHTVLADTDAMVQAAGQALASLGYAVYQHPTRIGGPVGEAVPAFLRGLDMLPADRPMALVGGGEVTVALPPGAPPGGRCQHAALVAARRIAGTDTLFLAAGSDGVDGTTREAGAWADGDTWQEGAAEALVAFDAHSHLDRLRQTLRTGAQATNVNDLWVALRSTLSTQR